MPNWEYKIITSGTLGFGSLQLLEQNLNQLGKEEWEIIHYQTRPDNPLAFTGLARRPVMRDWVVEGTPGAGPPAAKSGAIPPPPDERPVAAPSVQDLKAEAEGRRESLLAREETLRPLHREADEEPAELPEAFDEVADDEDLPTFFEAIRPHMRKNVRGPGMAVGIEYLAKKFEQSEADLVEALKECGFTLPSNSKDEPVYLEYDGDLYWLNLNHRGQLWINTREKPRAVFRPVQAHPVAGGEAAPGAPPAAAAPAGDVAPAPASESPPRESPAAPAEPPEPLPTGPALLDRLRPVMRRNRRGAGLSGSFSYLTRALRLEPPVLQAALAELGLVLPARPNDPPVFVEIGDFVYWLNQDKGGQIWINTRERRAGGEPPAESAPAGAPSPVPPEGLPAETPAASTEPGSAPAVAEASAATGSILASVRPNLAGTRRGGLGAEIRRLAEQLGRSPDDLITALVAGGLKVPDKPREKPELVGHGGECFWLSRTARGELWLNARPAAAAGQPEASGQPDAAGSEGSDAPAAPKRNRGPRRRRG